jgi:hypothetical protein
MFELSRMDAIYVSIYSPFLGQKACGQWRARRHGIAGIYGNPGIVESVTYRI